MSTGDTLDPFVLALVIIILGIVVIGLLFLRKIKKVHKLIETEYSLENLKLPSEEQIEQSERKK